MGIEHNSCTVPNSSLFVKLLAMAPPFHPYTSSLATSICFVNSFFTFSKPMYLKQFLTLRATKVDADVLVCFLLPIVLRVLHVGTKTIQFPTLTVSLHFEQKCAGEAGVLFQHNSGTACAFDGGVQSVYTPVAPLGIDGETLFHGDLDEVPLVFVRG
jgi:hypothetical protein